MLTEIDPHTARATLEWLVEMGCDEAIGEHPVNRFALPERMPAPDRPAPMTPAMPGQAAAPDDPVAAAERAAAAAATIPDLREALSRYPHCDLRLGTSTLVFADGDPAARVMIVGDAPDRDAARAGRPFAGPTGDLLDGMLAAIGLARDAADPGRAVYLAAALPWRITGHAPEPADMAMMLPFLRRHVELADPEVVVLMGNDACMAGLGETGMTRLRGTWTTAFGRPALPIFPPAHLIRQPLAKREAWADLLDLAARLDA